MAIKIVQRCLHTFIRATEEHYLECLLNKLLMHFVKNVSYAFEVFDLMIWCCKRNAISKGKLIFWFSLKESVVFTKHTFQRQPQSHTTAIWKNAVRSQWFVFRFSQSILSFSFTVYILFMIYAFGTIMSDFCNKLVICALNRNTMAIA